MATSVDNDGSKRAAADESAAPNTSETASKQSAPLFQGLRVIDCATVIAAPAAAMLLADFGADVIKIETPGEGDMLRLLSNIPTTPDAAADGGGPADGWFWQLDGRNKRSLALNLKTPEGLELIQELVRQADVFICNQPYDIRERFSLTYEALARINPTLIYASLTAYGEAGPERERKGFDQLAYWSRSGLMDLMRAPDTSPTQGLPGMGDHPTGVALYAGIVTALLHRERTGEGGLVHTSLLANGLWSAAGIAQGALAEGDMAGYRQTNRVNAAMLRVYEARDGRHLMFNMIRNEELLALLLAAMDALELLSDARFASAELMWENRAEFGDELQARIGERDSADWLALFREYDLPVNRVAIVEEASTDPQVLANSIAQVPDAASEIELPLLLNHPIQISSVARAPQHRAPRLGEHSAEILAELGCTSERIEELRNKGVIEG